MTTKAWKSKVAAIGCIVCRHLDLGETPATLHHVREGQGMSQRSSDFLIVPLCRRHHQSEIGIHGGKFYHLYKLDELDLLAMTLQAVL